MKKNAIVAAMLCLAVSPAVSVAEQVNARDPCTVFLCMAGKLYGEHASECDGAVKQFFSLNALKKKGRINPVKTLDMRKQFLMQCASADPAHVSKILNQSGRLRR